MPFCSRSYVLEKTFIPTRFPLQAILASQFSAHSQLNNKEIAHYQPQTRIWEGGSRLPKKIVRTWVKISRLFAIPPKPGLYPESPDSPGIITRQEISSRKKRVCVNHLATHEWSRRTLPKVSRTFLLLTNTFDS